MRGGAAADGVGVGDGEVAAQPGAAPRKLLLLRPKLTQRNITCAALSPADRSALELDSVLRALSTHARTRPGAALCSTLPLAAIIWRLPFSWQRRGCSVVRACQRCRSTSVIESSGRSARTVFLLGIVFAARA